MPLVEAGLLDILACPACRSPLREEEPSGEGAAPTHEGELVCTDEACGLAYPVRDGVPVLLVDEARRPG